MLPPVAVADPIRVAELGAQDHRCLVRQPLGMAARKQGADSPTQNRRLPWPRLRTQTQLRPAVMQPLRRERLSQHPLGLDVCEQGDHRVVQDYWL